MNQPHLLTASGEVIAMDGNQEVGRTPDCGITFASPEISRRHAAITARSGSWWLQDLGSKNGTFVNGSDIGTTLTCLGDGDTIVFGGTVSVQFKDPTATPLAPRIGQLDGVWIDPDSRAVWVDAVRIDPPLSSKQLALLTLLDEHRGDVVSRPLIVSDVWDDVAAEGVSDDAVTALVKRLRSRLREGPLRTDYVQVVKGRGIRLR